MKDLIIMKGENTIINSVNSNSSTAIAHYNKEEENLLKIDKNTPGQLQCHHHINEQKNGDDDCYLESINLMYNNTIHSKHNNNNNNNHDGDTLINKDCEENEKEKLVCYICTEEIEIHAISQCNHRICHICCLRLRYLFKSYNCAYCRTYQNQVYFTRDSKKSFDNNLKDNSCWHELSKLGIFCEDKTIYEKSMDLIIPKCPIDDCKFQCYSKNEDVDDDEANMEQENQDGVFELLYEHVREIHKLTYCPLCVSNRNFFIKEHELYTNDGIFQHFHGEGSKNNNNFKGHPICASCNLIFYDHSGFKEHCLTNHNNSDSNNNNNNNNSSSRSRTNISRTTTFQESEETRNFYNHYNNYNNTTNHNNSNSSNSSYLLFVIMKFVASLVRLIFFRFYYKEIITFFKLHLLLALYFINSYCFSHGANNNDDGDDDNIDKDKLMILFFEIFKSIICLSFKISLIHGFWLMICFFVEYFLIRFFIVILTFYFLKFLHIIILKKNLL